MDYLDPVAQERIRQASSQYLVEPWAIDENERMEGARIAFPRSQQPGDFEGNTYVSGRGAFGQYLRRLNTFPVYGAKLDREDTETIIRDLFRALKVASLVEVVLPGKNDEAPGYQVPASAFVWVAGDGSQPFVDPMRMPQASTVGGRVNPFFVRFYREVAADLHGIEAREHTAQVPYEEREQREDAFREARLPVLYCSPTMELGVDIAELNVVNMRNVPPTPANYAQRSGRAGRSGQPALVFTYCTTGSPHDQYFFKRPERMVAGAVTPPRLDLANEDLVRAHVHAVWLAETGLSLGRSLKDVLDVSLAGGKPTLDAASHRWLHRSARSTRQRRAAQRVGRILRDVGGRAGGRRLVRRRLARPRPGTRRRAVRPSRATAGASLYRAAWRQREMQHQIIERRLAQPQGQADRPSGCARRPRRSSSC